MVLRFYGAGQQCRPIDCGAATIHHNIRIYRWQQSGQSTLDANKVVSLPPGDTTLTFQQVQIPANMAQQSYTPTIRLRGTENGNGFSRDLPVDVNELQVTAPSDVQILATRPSQPSVTRAMEKDWTITMLVRNNGGTAVQLDSVKLILFNGGDVTGEYSLVTPTQF